MSPKKVYYKKKTLEIIKQYCPNCMCLCEPIPKIETKIIDKIVVTF